jgi:hypothetical protein
MSTTSIYILGSEPGEIGECRNSWRGAMYVWNDIAKRYCGMESFPFSGSKQSDVWNANRHHMMPEHDAIVLLSTMDNAIVWGRDAKTVADAFDRYGREHPESSLAEQAEILRSATLNPDDALAWQQTSVGEFWGQSWNEEKEDYDWYNPLTGVNHFDVLQEARTPRLVGQQPQETE